MGSFKKYRDVLLGLGAATGVAIYYCSVDIGKNIALNSWTTNFIPTTKWDNNWDHRSPSTLMNPKKIHSSKDENNILSDALETMKPSATRHILLIRHGQYNLDGNTDSDRILTKLGRTQAEYTGKRLKELGLPITHMVKSTMSRAQETGSLISQHLPDVPVEHCDLLREGAPIPPEPPIGSWKPETFFYQDGARIEAAFRRYFHRADASQERDTYTVLVCHANVIRYFVCRALQFPPEAWLRLSLNHASITWLTITPSGRVILRAMGDSGHMPPTLITSR